jgi:uncharacterized damage-inducible protein DinB
MKAFFEDLTNYNHYYNNKIIAVLNENPGIVSEHCIKLMSHIVNVHSIWNNKIRPAKIQYERWQIHPIHEFHAINKNNYENTLLILNSFDLDQPIDYTLSTGQAFKHPVRDLLFHALNHSTYHRGQIATEFRRMGLEPTLTDFIMFKMLNA